MYRERERDMHVYIYIYVYFMYIYIHACVHIYMCIFIYTCMHIYMYIQACMYLYNHICIYIHTYHKFIYTCAFMFVLWRWLIPWCTQHSTLNPQHSTLNTQLSLLSRNSFLARPPSLPLNVSPLPSMSLFWCACTPSLGRATRTHVDDCKKHVHMSQPRTFMPALQSRLSQPRIWCMRGCCKKHVWSSDLISIPIKLSMYRHRASLGIGRGIDTKHVSTSLRLG